MAASRREVSLRRLRADLGRRAFHPESWLLSAVFHAVFVLVLFATAEHAIGPSAGDSPRDGGIALDSRLEDPSSNEQYYDDEEASGAAFESAAAPTIAGEHASAGAPSPFDERPPVDPSGSLPNTSPLIGTGLGGDGTALSAAGMADSAGESSGTKGGSRGRTSVYGLDAEGNRFIYIFDRSGSMGGSGRNPLSAAKAELLSSLESLDRMNQFQIIFYNDQSTVFAPAGQRGRLVFGDERSKAEARSFVQGITADGATRHREALIHGLRMQPDVIFFLTDANEPRLSQSELKTIRDMNAGAATIHAIEFGIGPASNRENFLTQLARENGGRHTYVDITTFNRAN